MKTDKRFIWNCPPKIVSEFYDDFSSGLRPDVWRAMHEKWKSQVNNGFSDENCAYTTYAPEVERLGASGGVVVLRSQGDFSAVGEQRRGGGIVTKKAFGAGLYEVRFMPVPRAGQCSAAWTYYNDWAAEYDKRKYSEIDIEMPHGGDYRFYSGTTYENYMSGEQKNSASEIIDAGKALNDGKWHTLAFEWRTAENDTGIIWSLDGKPLLRIDEAVPKYKATFWVASLFQNAIAWLGDPLFETAYMFIDYVRICEYDDPIEESVEFQEENSPYCGRDLGKSPVPQTDYVSDGNFARPAETTSFNGKKIYSWRLSGAAKLNNHERLLVFSGDGKAAQTITAQYAGFSFKCTVSGKVKSGAVSAKLICCKGKANCDEPKLTDLCECAETLTLEAGENSKTIEFHITEKQTEHIRLEIESRGGNAEIDCVSLILA